MLRVLFLIVMTSFSAVAETPVLNQYVLKAVKSMPQGGGYEASQKAVDRLAASVSVKNGRIEENLKTCKASFCSGATYIIFLRTLDLLQDNQALTLNPKDLKRYATLSVQDGEEVFGRWNANGPGTAKLFTDLRCGVNFTSYTAAQPGDFLKIWWTDKIGGKERGHLVVYLSQTADSVTFWSSNQPKGYGKKTVAKSKIKRALFSRLTDHRKLVQVTRLSTKDQFLADMLRKDFTWKQVMKECSVKEKP